jgi:hypothetical protein
VTAVVVVVESGSLVPGPVLVGVVLGPSVVSVLVLAPVDDPDASAPVPSMMSFPQPPRPLHSARQINRNFMGISRSG